MSVGLIIFRSQRIEFELDTIIRAICSINDVYATEKIQKGSFSDYSIFIGKYRYGSEYINFELDNHLLCITTDTLNEAALNFALALKEKLNVSLSATDDNYSFSSQLNGISSVHEFKTIILQGVHSDEQ